MTLDDVKDSLEIAVWPDNMQSVSVFVSVTTQWRSAGYGPTGLDYSALASVVKDLLLVPEVERPQIFDDVRIMEEAALNVMRHSNG